MNNMQLSMIDEYISNNCNSDSFLEISYCIKDNIVVNNISFHNPDNNIIVDGVIPDKLLVGWIRKISMGKEFTLKTLKFEKDLNGFSLYQDKRTILTIKPSCNEDAIDNYRYARINNNYIQVIQVHFLYKFNKEEKDEFLNNLSSKRMCKMFENMSLDEQRNMLRTISLDKLYSLFGISGIKQGVKVRELGEKDARRFFN